MKPCTLVDEIVVNNKLGEGVQWRPDNGSVWWTDILDCKLYYHDFKNRQTQVIDVPEPLGSFAFTSSPTTIVAAFARGFAFFNYQTGIADWIEKPPMLPGEGRFNDGRADRQGRFWSGTMMAEPGNGVPATGRLFCLGPYGHSSQHEQAVNISNGLCWSPDGRTLYFADSLTGKIFQYDFSPERGTLGNKRVFAKSPEGGAPDGAAVDAYGNVWSAQWGLGEVIAFNPDGDIIDRVSVPASQPTCVAFGGDNLDLMFVTSAKDGLPETRLAKEPSAGNVFVYKTGTRGLPENTYSGVAAHKESQP